MNSHITPSADFVYHPHQKVGINWMLSREQPGARFVRGGILADEMGLGKTCMTLGLLLNDPLIATRSVNTLLLVPPVLSPQWAKALGDAGITYLQLQPPKAVKKGTDVTPDVEAARWSWTQYTGTRPNLVVFLSTYVRAANHINTLSTLPFDRMVCDEGHVFRNGYRTALFRKLITVPAAQRWILTGTPIQNDVSDFGNLLKFLGMPAEQRMNTNMAVVALEVLLRRNVGEVREAVPTMPTLPPTHTIHAISMVPGSEEEKVYDALVGRYEDARENHAAKAIVFELFLRISQFVTHPAIYVSSMVTKYGPAYPRTAWVGSASKFEAFVDFMRTSTDVPTIVFTTFKQEMDLGVESLTAQGYRCWKIEGGMTDKAREDATRESKACVDGGATKVAIFVQIVAGGAGLNLQHCKRVVFISPHWNPAVVDQAVARAYRMGQTERVEVHHFLMADDAALNMDRYKSSMHGDKRKAALGVHGKLYCDSAVSAEHILGELDRAPTVATVATVAAAAEAEAEDPTGV